MSGANVSGAVLSGEKTSILEKISFYFVSAGAVIGNGLVAGALLLFYTNVVGLDPARIAILFLVARVFDGVNDPIQAYIIDHLPKTKLGRFRTYLMIGAILFSINLVLVFFGPYWVSGAKLLVAWITYIMLDMTSCFMTIPNDCLLPVMTDHPKDRNILSIIKGIAVTAGTLLIALPLPLLLAAMEDNLVTAFGIVVFGGAICTVLFVSLGALGIKERIPKKEEQKYSVKELLKIFIERPVYALFLSYFLINIATATAAAVGLYFFIYVVQNLVVMPLLNVASIIFGLIGVLFVPMLANRYGKKKSFVIGMLIMFGAMALRLIDVTNVWILIVTAGVNTFGSSMSHPLAYGIMADNTDYVEYKTGKRAEGAVAALNSFQLKASAGIGGVIVGYALSWSGFDPGPLGGGFVAQSPSVVNALTAMMVIFPALAALGAAIIFFFLYPLTNEKMKEITTELHIRRGEIEEGAAPPAQEAVESDVAESE